MALTLKKPGNKETGKVTKAKKINKNKLPTKNTINLVGVGKKKLHPAIIALIVVVVLAAVALFTKFAIIDRFEQVKKAQTEVSDMRTEIDLLYKKIASYGEINELYAHYTITGMTDAELNRADRIEAIEMLESIVEPTATLGAMTFKDNTLTATVTAENLQAINIMAGKINEQPNVDYCTIATASTETKKDENAGEVTARITIYLKKAVEELEEEAAK